MKINSISILEYCTTLTIVVIEGTSVSRCLWWMCKKKISLLLLGLLQILKKIKSYVPTSYTNAKRLKSSKHPMQIIIMCNKTNVLDLINSICTCLFSKQLMFNLFTDITVLNQIICIKRIKINKLQ